MNLRLLGGNELDLSRGRLQFVSDAQEVRQAIETRLSLVKGEWFLDPDAGLPLWDRVLVKGPNLAVVKNEIRKIILATDGATGLVSLTLSLDRGSRQVSATFVATTNRGLVAGSWPTSGAVPAVPRVIGFAETAIFGSADRGSTVTVLVDGVVSGSVAVGADGSWSLNVPGLMPGSAVTARASNVNGTSAESSPVYVPLRTVSAGAPNSIPWDGEQWIVTE